MQRTVRVNDSQLVMLSERAHFDHSMAGYPVSYTHLDVYKRQISVQPLRLQHCGMGESFAVRSNTNIILISPTQTILIIKLFENQNMK